MKTKPIEQWTRKDFRMTKPQPLRFVATIEAGCNLACQHCYWSHEIVNSKQQRDWREVAQRLSEYKCPVIYAGRVLTKSGARFIGECLDRGIEVGVIDNGYTILNHPSLLESYQNIDISLDGWREAHDTQRGKAGSFDKAWGTILELKRLGFDPVVSSAFSIHSFNGWEKFEELLAVHDVPMSSTLVWSLPETLKRGTSVFEGQGSVIKAFQKLTSGIPKLINLYALEHVATLEPLLKELDWEFNAEGDGFQATYNSTIVQYRANSLLANIEAQVLWDGQLHTPPYVSQIILPKTFSDSYIQKTERIRSQELSLWKKILTKGKEVR